MKNKTLIVISIIFVFIVVSVCVAAYQFTRPVSYPHHPCDFKVLKNNTVQLRNCQVIQITANKSKIREYIDAGYIGVREPRGKLILIPIRQNGKS